MSTKGYEQLADLFARYTDLASFRSFSKLGYECLLFQQAAITEIELDIEQMREKEPLEIRQSWIKMKAAEPESLPGEKYQKFLGLQKMLRDYRTDVCQMRALAALGPPPTMSVGNLRDWLISADCGQDFLSGFESRPWQLDFQSDLIPIAQQPDRLDQAVSSAIAPLWHRMARHLTKASVDEEQGLGKLWHYHKKHFTRMANIFTVFVSAGVPSASIVALCWAHNMTARLIIISGLTLVLAAIVLLVFGGRRAETFGAALAFCAVEVVFLESVANIRA